MLEVIVYILSHINKNVSDCLSCELDQHAIISEYESLTSKTKWKLQRPLELGDSLLSTLLAIYVLCMLAFQVVHNQISRPISKYNFDVLTCNSFRLLSISMWRKCTSADCCYFCSIKWEEQWEHMSVSFQRRRKW